MNHELVVFWRHADGTRCVVAKGQPTGWRLLVVQGDRTIVSEDYEDPRVLLARAYELRPLFKSAVA